MPIAAAASTVVVVVALLGRVILPTSDDSSAGPTSVGTAPMATPSGAVPSPSASSPAPTSSVSAWTEPTLAAGTLAIATNPPDSPGMDALAIGTLGGGTRPDGACFWFEGSSRVALSWPYGFSARNDPLRLIGGDGQVLARRGDHVELGGGTFPNYVPTPEQDPCKTGDLFVVSTLASVNGVPLDVGGGSLHLITRARGTSGFCSDAPRVALMLVMVDGRLQVRNVSTGVTIPATWPQGFVAHWGNRITMLDAAGTAVMTQGVEDAAVRARMTPQGADICGFGDKIYA